MTTVLKVGGSVITEKASQESVDEAALRRVATAVATADERLVLVHGGGSFGHPAAAQFGVDRTAGTFTAEEAWEIHRAMIRLNDAVIEALHRADADALPVRPLSVGRRDASGTLRFPTPAIEGMLEAGFLPTIHGDGVVHDGAGVTVLGGDEVTVVLAEALGADRVGFCTGAPGVLDDDGTVIPVIEGYETVTGVLTDGPGTDVTGGMGAKVQTLLEYPGSARIFGLSEIDAFLRGADPGTLVR